MDLIEIDAASNTRVDDVRELREAINFSPSQGQYKVYIIDEVHMLSTAAFNALLKTLEEPPAHAIFVLATTEVHKIPATVLSRCQRHEFRRIPVQGITGYLRQICKSENINIDEDALVLIARQSTGSMRDAISLLDQLASTGEKISLATAQAVLGTATSQAVVALVDALLNHQANAGLECVHQALDGGTDSRQFARQVVEYLRGVLLIRLGNPDQVEATTEQRQQMTAQANRFDLPLLLDCIRSFNTAASEVRGGWQPGLLLELAVAESVAPRMAPPQPAALAQTGPVQNAPENRPYPPSWGAAPAATVHQRPVISSSPPEKPRPPKEGAGSARRITCDAPATGSAETRRRRPVFPREGHGGRLWPESRPGRDPGELEPDQDRPQGIQPSSFSCPVEFMRPGGDQRRSPGDWF